MPNEANKPRPSSARQILYRRFYERHPERQAQLNETRSDMEDLADAVRAGRSDGFRTAAFMARDAASMEPEAAPALLRLAELLDDTARDAMHEYRAKGGRPREHRS